MLYIAVAGCNKIKAVLLFFMETSMIVVNWVPKKMLSMAFECRHDHTELVIASVVLVSSSQEMQHAIIRKTCHTRPCHSFANTALLALHSCSRTWKMAFKAKLLLHHATLGRKHWVQEGQCMVLTRASAWCSSDLFDDGFDTRS
jgi:hypothetical protein